MQGLRKRKVFGNEFSLFGKKHKIIRMKENINDLATILAVSLLADGEVGDQENKLLEDLEHDTELPGLASSIRQVVSMAHLFSDEQLTDLLYNSAAKFSSEDKPKVFEAAICTILSDGVVTLDEIGNVLTLAEALEIPVEKAVARLLYQVQEKEGDLVVDVEQDLEDFIIIGGKTRYTSWNSFEKMLIESNYSSNLISILASANNWAENTFQSDLLVNYTPNFLTLACTNPISRSKTFCFIRMKPNCIRFEYSGKVKDLSDANELSDEIKSGIIEYFNHLSINKL
jgi:hypothetical protein